MLSRGDLTPTLDLLTLVNMDYLFFDVARDPEINTKVDCISVAVRSNTIHPWCLVEL